LLAETQLVMGEGYAYFLPALISVWLGLGLKYVKRIAAYSALFFHLWLNHPEAVQKPTERSPLLGDDANATTATSLAAKNALSKIYKESSGIRDLFYLAWGSKESKVLTRRYRRNLRIYTFLLAGLCVGMIVLGVYSAKIKSIGAAALLEFDHPGLWLFDRSRASREARTRAGVLDLEKETRAGEYAQNCYDTADSFDSIRCDFLYHRSIPFGEPDFTGDCPFDLKICGERWVTFRTGEVDASALGINVPATPKFRRNTTCTPLNMDSPYIRNETINGTTSFYYQYGGKRRDGFNNPPVNYTHNTTGNPFDLVAPVYDVL
jgi:hypothetical protein